VVDEQERVRVVDVRDGEEADEGADEGEAHRDDVGDQRHLSGYSAS